MHIVCSETLVDIDIWQTPKGPVLYLLYSTAVDKKYTQGSNTNFLHSSPAISIMPSAITPHLCSFYGANDLFAKTP